MTKRGAFFCIGILLFPFLGFGQSGLNGLFDWGSKGSATPQMPKNTFAFHAGAGYPNLFKATLGEVADYGDQIDQALGIANQLQSLAFLVPGLETSGIDGVITDINTYNQQLSNIDKGTNSPQFNFSIEYAITNNITVGPYYGYATGKSEGIDVDLPEFDLNQILDDNNIPASGLISALGTVNFQPGNLKSLKYRVNTVGIKAAWHTNLIEKVDVYAIGGFGKNFTKTTSEDGAVAEIDYPDLSYSGHIGVQYYFTRNIGLYLEGGYGVGVNAINFGLAWRFGKGLAFLDELN